MSNFNWTTQNVQYVVNQFDAGVPFAQILTRLQSSGYETLRLVMIEQCLRANGRNVNVYNPQVSHAFPSRTFGARPTKSAHESLVVRPQSNQGRGWDSAAGNYVMHAHSDRRSIVDIWEDLRRDGYGVKVSDVTASLQAQGVDVGR